jgi:hypothetical protein
MTCGSGWTCIHRKREPAGRRDCLLTPRLWAYYEQAKTDGYVVLPDQSRGTFPLRDCWFTWTEASYHPYVYVQKKRGDKWLVSMDNIAFYDGRGPLYLLNTPERYAQSVRLLRNPFLDIAVHNRVSLSSSPYVLVQLDVLGFERAAYVARVLVRTGKAALSTAMKAQQKAAESEPTTKAIM